jgi:hypothetical protein
VWVSGSEEPDGTMVAMEMGQTDREGTGSKDGSLRSTGVPVSGSARVSVLVGSDSMFPTDAFGLS